MSGRFMLDEIGFSCGVLLTLATKAAKFDSEPKNLIRKYHPDLPLKTFGPLVGILIKSRQGPSLS